jgi:hypothetical protein
MDKNLITKNKVLIITFFVFIYTYFSKISYQLGHIDEINYLSDSLLLFEGMIPSSKHAPSGISTWIGTFIIFLDLLFRSLFIESVSSILDFFKVIDKVLYFHYSNLIFIKLSLFLLNSILLVYLFTLDNKKIFFVLFLFIFTSPLYIETILTGKPFLTAAIFFSISLFLKKKNYLLSLIFLALAISEKWEYILLINFICYEKNKKIKIKDYLTVLLIFSAISPWFIISLLQNIKIQLNYILWNSVAFEASIFSLLIFISLITYIVTQFILNFIQIKKIRFLLFLVLILNFIYLVFVAEYYIRWFIPLFIILIYELSENNLIKNNIPIFILALITILFQIKFNLNNFPSNSDWIEIEEKSNKSIFIVGDSLLKEKNNYKKYFNIRNKQLNKKNVKNVGFFKDSEAPIAFSESSLIEKSYLRRFEYLQKYSYGEKEKYLYHISGVNMSIDFLCNLNPDDKKNILIIRRVASSLYKNLYSIKKDKFSDYKFETCE